MRKTSKNFQRPLLLSFAVFTAHVCAQDPAGLPVERAVLTAAPNVPPPIRRNHPARVLVDLEVVEKTMELADGVEYMFWTFGGTVPGSFIRIREGDTVEFTLHNHPDSKVPHNIDLHAVTGQGGGAEATFTPPGQSTKFSFKALNSGLYVYHCATQPVGLHVANGMYGLILVEPKTGLSPVDREYYVFQSEFYTAGKHGEQGFQPFDMDKALAENPEYVVFNGRVGSLTGENALKANTGETVRLFVGNGGPNLASSFHVIGEIFDWVHVEAGTLMNRNVQTTTVPPGGATIVEMKLEVPGNFILVDHALFRAFNKGAIGILNVEGKKNPDIYSGQISQEPYSGDINNPRGRAPALRSEPVPAPAVRQPAHAPEPPPSRRPPERVEARPAPAPARAVSAADPASIERGKRVYATSCFACHQNNGEGLPGVFPPLANSDYLLGNVDESIDVVLRGRSGQIVVNNRTYNQVMPAQNLTDQQTADVMNYVLNAWGNRSDEVVQAERVQRIRRNPLR